MTPTEALEYINGQKRLPYYCLTQKEQDAAWSNYCKAWDVLHGKVVDFTTAQNVPEKASVPQRLSSRYQDEQELDMQRNRDCYV